MASGTNFLQRLSFWRKRSERWSPANRQVRQPACEAELNERSGHYDRNPMMAS